MKKLLKSSAFDNFLSSVIAVLIGLLVGLIILLICNPTNALSGMVTILLGGFNNSEFTANVSKILYYAVSYITCGLAVGFAYKTGTLNLGVSGQYWAGGFVAIVTSLNFYPTLGAGCWILSLIFAVLAGALIAAIPGVLKAVKNVNIIITCIMMNYIATFIVSLILKNTPAIFDTAKSRTVALDSGAILPKWGLDVLFPSKGSGASAGIIIAIVLGIICWFVIQRTTFGYELKMCGLNRHAAHFTGINEKKNIILSMLISGGIAGLAGGLVYLSSTSNQILVTSTVTGIGFTGVAVALLGFTHPIGIIVAGMFISYIQVGGIYLQTLGYKSELVDVIIAAIIYSCAFSLLIATKLRERSIEKGVSVKV